MNTKDYVVFTADDIIELEAENGKPLGNLEYSTDGETWKEWDGCEIISSTDDDGLENYYALLDYYIFADYNDFEDFYVFYDFYDNRNDLDGYRIFSDLHDIDNDNKIYVGNNDNCHNIFLRGSDNTALCGSLRIYGDNVAVGGNIMALLDYRTVRAGKMPIMGEEAFYRLFYGNSAISTVDGSFLPAIELTDGCYKKMFADCENLTQAPELPAEELADSCCYKMFFGCHSLTQDPNLSSEILKKNIRPTGMFEFTPLEQLNNETFANQVPIPPPPLTQSPKSVLHSSDMSSQSYVIFTAQTAIELDTENSGSLGNMEYSRNGITWYAWNGGKIFSAANSNGRTACFSGAAETPN